jgi:Rad3-related DNA helicase
MWSLKEENKDLKPLVFSNGKNQQDIVKETLDAINQGHQVIFIRGVCGSGKSGIALNIAKELGKTSIIVPIKSLQKQYEQDYMSKKQVLKKDNSPLNITMITGRNNHKCIYLQNNQIEVKETLKKEKNAKLFDIFQQSDNYQTKNRSDDPSADNPYIPCKIEIKEKNLSTLKKYYQENPEKDKSKDLNIKVMKRMAVAPACPYWSPILPSNMKINLEADKQEYSAINGDHTIFLRECGCPYYKQFLSYKNSDVIMFNSQQYLLETMLGRKPFTQVEIVDECDEFLDSLTTEGIININRLRTESSFLYSPDPQEARLIESLNSLLREVLQEAKINSKTENKIMPLKETKALELIKIFAANDYLQLTQDEDSYIEHCDEIANKFSELIPHTYISYYKSREREEYGIKLVTIYLDKVFDFFLSKNKVFVMMSGTLHNERVLKEIFGIKDFKIIEAETINQGAIEKVRTGLEKDFKYANYKNNLVTRKDYLKALDLCVSSAYRPCIVHVSAFSDLPSESELEDPNLQPHTKNLISREELRQSQQIDKKNQRVLDFKSGKTDLLFTTKCSRGIDFPHNTCNSVVITKFPYPNTQSLFWQILQRQKPIFYWDFYKDKAHRELLQKIYRSVRAKDDHVFLLSPDIRVLNSNVI